MKFDANGNRIAPRAPAMERRSAYWFEQEKVDTLGYCDELFPCEDVDDLSHLCGRYSGHGGYHASLHFRTEGGRTQKTIELGGA